MEYPRGRTVKETLAVINRLEADGIIGRWAIGGAVGALFYLEPADTVDIDVFVSFRDTHPSGLVSLAPIYAHLAELGFTETRNEGIVIGAWPVQFLPADDPLGAEALADAIETTVEQIPMRVMTAEHLVALALRTGRGKDHLRILAFLERDILDANRLQDILSRHGLAGPWLEFKAKFLPENPG